MATAPSYPKGSIPGRYRPDEAIGGQTARNDKAVDLLINAAVH
jgi:hypothetical protein